MSASHLHGGDNVNCNCKFKDFYSIVSSKQFLGCFTRPLNIKAKSLGSKLTVNSQSQKYTIKAQSPMLGITQKGQLKGLNFSMFQQRLLRKTLSIYLPHQRFKPGTQPEKHFRELCVVDGYPLNLGMFCAFLGQMLT